jgi:hypothetical protein
MKRISALILLITTALFVSLALAEQAGDPVPPRRITLQEAVQLALKHNHNIRIAATRSRRNGTQRKP